MRLDQALVLYGFCESRTEAQELIEASQVTVNGSVTTKQIKQVTEIDVLEVTARRKFVSRGGEKIEGAMLDIFTDEASVRAELLGKEALDVGSSTGGFTDFLLEYGVRHVDAVDVGTNQLHQSLRNDTRISLFENTDIRKFNTEKKYGIVVADLSFISLEQVLTDCFQFGKQGAHYFLLIKPQFEVGRGNTKKGIVKDEALVRDVLDKYETHAQEHRIVGVKVLPSRIQGGDGNQEYFLYGKKA